MTECKERGLSTARAVLCVLSHVAESDEGVSAREVADRLQKSLSTAYHLLASLEAEGFVARVGRAGGYRLVADKLTVPSAEPVAAGIVIGDVAPAPPDLADLQARMRQVFAVTGRRTSIGVVSGDGVRMLEDIGRQGLPRMGNLEQPTIRATAHALAVGKLMLAGLDDDALQRWQAGYGLQPFTPATIVDPPALRRELDEVRARGIAAECGEYDADFGSLAVPVVDAGGSPVAVVAVTVTRHQFAMERDTLEPALLAVTGELEETRTG